MNYEVELIASKSIKVNLKADNEEDARLQAEEIYYSSHSIDDTLEDFYIKDVVEMPADDEWAV